MNDGGRQPSAAVGGDSVNHDYINLHDLIGDSGDDDDEQGDVVLGLEDVEIFLNFANRMDKDDVLFRNPKWLENFEEMKQATLDPLYEGCPKHLKVLCYNL